MEQSIKLGFCKVPVSHKECPDRDFAFTSSEKVWIHIAQVLASSSPLGPVRLYCPAVDAALSSQSDRAEPEDQGPRERAVRARAEARALFEQESHQCRAGPRERHEPDAAAQRRELPSFESAGTASVAHELAERHEARPALETRVWAAV